MSRPEIYRDAIRQAASGDQGLGIGAIRIHREHSAASQIKNEQTTAGDSPECTAALKSVAHGASSVSINDLRALNEREEVGINHFRVGGTHAVRIAFVDLQRTV